MDYISGFTVLYLVIAFCVLAFIIWAVLAHIKALRRIADGIETYGKQTSDSARRIASRFPAPAPAPGSSSPKLSVILGTSADGRTIISVGQADSETSMVTLLTSQTVTVVRRSDGCRVLWGDNRIIASDVTDDRDLTRTAPKTPSEPPKPEPKKKEEKKEKPKKGSVKKEKPAVEERPGLGLRACISDAGDQTRIDITKGGVPIDTIYTSEQVSIVERPDSGIGVLVGDRLLQVESVCDERFD